MTDGPSLRGRPLSSDWVSFNRVVLGHNPPSIYQGPRLPVVSPPASLVLSTQKPVAVHQIDPPPPPEPAEMAYQGADPTAFMPQGYTRQVVPGWRTTVRSFARRMMEQNRKYVAIVTFDDLKLG